MNSQANATPSYTPISKLRFEEFKLPFALNAPKSWLKFSPKSEQIAVAYQENANVDIFDVITGQLQAKLIKPKQARISRGVNYLSWSPNGKLFAVSYQDNTSLVWDVSVITAPRVVLTIDQPATVFNISWSPDSNQLAFAYTNAETIISVWDLTSKNVTESFPKEIRQIQWSPNGKWIAVLKWGLAGELIDYSTRNTILTLSPSIKDGFVLNQIAASWSPDSQRLIVVDCNATSADCIVWFQDITDSKHILGSDSSSTTLGIGEFAWQPNSSIVATNSGESVINIWDANSGTLLSTIDTLENRAASLDWNFDGTILAAVTADGSTRAWKTIN
ncbi:MAG: WD40 repeat domain-containing protein [Chloroflexota bacterium]